MQKNRTFYAKGHRLKYFNWKVRILPIFIPSSRESEWVYGPERHLTLLPKVCILSWYPQSLGHGCRQRVYSSEPLGVERVFQTSPIIIVVWLIMKWLKLMEVMLINGSNENLEKMRMGEKYWENEAFDNIDAQNPLKL